MKLSSQHIAVPYLEAKKQGISSKHLDSVYISALHADTTLAVFRTEKDQEAMRQAYLDLLQDLGKYLSAHNFYWAKPTRSFNRIYFNRDGTIDYFFYSFKGPADEQPTEQARKEFQQLLTLFIKDYKLPLKSNVNFAQCSPTTYMPK